MTSTGFSEKEQPVIPENVLPSGFSFSNRVHVNIARPPETHSPEKQSILDAMEHLLAKYREMRPLFLVPALPIKVEWKMRPYFGVFPLVFRALQTDKTARAEENVRLQHICSKWTGEERQHAHRSTRSLPKQGFLCSKNLNGGGWIFRKVCQTAGV